MNPIVEIVEAAEREVLAHTIESTRGLRAYLCQHGGEAQLTLLQEEAVRRGLYRYMGECYAKVLETMLCRTRQCIAFGRIKTDDELRVYLIDLARSGECYAKVLETMLCRTRQCIAFGRIKTDDELRVYLIDLARSLVRYRDLALAKDDLLIHARQTGLYSLLASTAAHHGSPHDRDPAMQDRIRSGIKA